MLSSLLLPHTSPLPSSKDFVDKKMAQTPEEPLAFDPALD